MSELFDILGEPDLIQREGDCLWVSYDYRYCVLRYHTQRQGSLFDVYFNDDGQVTRDSSASNIFTTVRTFDDARESIRKHRREFDMK